MQQAERLFVPSRLATARKWRGLSKTALSRLVGVSVPRLTEFEGGQGTPSPDVLEQLARVLGVASRFLEGDELVVVDPGDVSFRSRRSLAANVRDRVTGALGVAAGVLSPAIRRRFRLPALDLPDLAGWDPEAAADELHRYWRLSDQPLSNMLHLLEAKGVELYWLDEDDEKLDALSAWVDGHPVVMMSLASDAGDRARFDGAHELGHLVLHRDASNLGCREHEQQANAFAGAFLLPRSWFKRHCPRRVILEEFLRLKSATRVSVQAMLRRGRDVGILTERQYNYGLREINQRNWRREEPMKPPRETSYNHRFIFEAFQAKGLSPADFAAEICLQVDDLLSLMPIASEFCGPRGHLRLV